jgi:hypothetical protein
MGVEVPAYLCDAEGGFLRCEKNWERFGGTIAGFVLNFPLNKILGVSISKECAKNSSSKLCIRSSTKNFSLKIMSYHIKSLIINSPIL